MLIPGQEAPDATALLRSLVPVVFEAVDPERLVSRELAARPCRPTAILALGKAAAALARGTAGHEPPSRARCLALRPAPAPELARPGWTELSGGHPLPDAGSLRAGHHLEGWLASLRREDLLLALVSGGGSAAVELPAGGLELADLAALTRRLLASPIPIDQLNTVRRHVSRLKGGGALAATAARVRVLLLSDVPWDDPAAVASGPFAADPTTYADALRILEPLAAEGDAEQPLPAAVLEHLRRGAAGEVAETVKPGDPRLARVEHRLLAGNRAAVAAAAGALEARGLPVVCGELDGEASGAGRSLVAAGRSAEPRRGAAALVRGGETTVRLSAGDGPGGRCQELALAAARELAGSRGEAVLALATDGVDGPTPYAGAVVDGGTWKAILAAGGDPRSALHRHASTAALRRVPEALLEIGPSGSNVADLAVYLRFHPP